MNSPAVDSLDQKAFRVESISPIPDPLGGSDHWCRYVISQGSYAENAIVGERAGAVVDVSQQVQQMVERLNERLGKAAAKKK